MTNSLPRFLSLLLLLLLFRLFLGEPLLPLVLLFPLPRIRRQLAVKSLEREEPRRRRYLETTEFNNNFNNNDNNNNNAA